MLNFAINNEAIQGGVPIPLLTNNPYIEDMSIMARISVSLNEQESQLSKKCSKCGKTKSVNEFHKKLKSVDGLKSQCKKCISRHSKQYREDNKEKILARNKAYYQNNKDKVAEYYRDHKNHKNVHSRLYY